MKLRERVECTGTEIPEIPTEIPEKALRTEVPAVREITTA
jgi:hypothetical protein